MTTTKTTTTTTAKTTVGNTKSTRSKSILIFPLNISVHLLFLSLFQTTILQSVFVVVVFVDSFQLNNNFNVGGGVFPRTFRNSNSVSSTTRAISSFTFTNDSSCRQSKSKLQRYFTNNKNDLIRMYSTSTNNNNNNKELLSVTKKEKTNDNDNDTKNKKEMTTTKQKETTTSKTILDVKRTISATEQKQKQKLEQKQTRRRTWEDSYKLLKQYKEEWGDCLVPQNYKPDKKLGVWVRDQRQQAKKGKLKSQRKDKLNEIGFSWDANVDNWNYMMEELKEFQEEFGHSNVERFKDKSRQSLAHWVANQRHLSRALLTNEQCSQLDELGFVWEDVKKARGDRQWEEQFEALQDYQRVYGDTRVPKSVSHNNVKLGKWVSTQREYYHKGILRKDREDKLNSIGFIWKLKDQNITDYKKLHKIWMKNLEKLKDFKTIYNHTSVPYKYKEDPKLGLWVSNQKANYRRGVLKKSRQEMLESIGFEWNPKEQTRENQWMDQYHNLAMFQKKHGHVDVPSSSHSNLYEWLYRQRLSFANKKLESEQKELLEKLGVNLNVGPGSRNTMLD